MGRGVLFLGPKDFLIPIRRKGTSPHVSCKVETTGLEPLDTYYKTLYVPLRVPRIPLKEPKGHY